jgi:catechol 2,3-dioxygenase-like lactoylglutathione lyase family enzyme
MTQAAGIHHIAIMSGDMKGQIEFFSQVLGCPLAAVFDMHGVEGALHAFLKLNDHCYFSIVQMPGVAEIPIELGKTHSGTGADICAPGAMQHIAFNVDDMDQLLAMRDRIRSHGVNVIGPVDHGFCHSIYFAGPDQLTLEVTTPMMTIEATTWVDPKALEALGISAEEGERFMRPPQYTGPSPVPQPPYDPAMPHQTFPQKMYLKLLSLPDEEFSRRTSYPDPPIKAA